MMIKVLKIISVLLLLFNGVGAIYGGYMLIADPSGMKMQLQLSYLQHSPFENYLIPGVVLFTCNGVMSLIPAVFIIFNLPQYPKLIFLQGWILLGWIIIQVMMIKIVYYLHFLLGGVGLALIVSGIWLHISMNRKFLFEKIRFKLN